MWKCLGARSYHRPHTCMHGRASGSGKRTSRNKLAYPRSRGRRSRCLYISYSCKQIHKEQRRTQQRATVVSVQNSSSNLCKKSKVLAYAEVSNLEAPNAVGSYDHTTLASNSNNSPWVSPSWVSPLLRPLSFFSYRSCCNGHHAMGKKIPNRIMRRYYDGGIENEEIPMLAY